MCVCVLGFCCCCVHVCVHMCVEIRGHVRCLSQCLSTLLRQILSMDLELTDLTGVAGKQIQLSSISASSASGLQTHTPTPILLQGLWGSKPLSPSLQSEHFEERVCLPSPRKFPKTFSHECSAHVHLQEARLHSNSYEPFRF